MQISIFQKILPFSMRPGIKMLVPGTSIRATIFPTRIEFHELSMALPVFLGAVEFDFVQPEHPTVQLDLEKGSIIVWGQSNKNFYRYTLSGVGTNQCLELKSVKGVFTLTGNDLTVKSQDASWLISFDHTFQQLSKAPFLEKISFGSHKKQDWELVSRRNDAAEIFPILYQLAQWIPPQKPAVFEGVASLIPACCKAITNGEPNQLLHPFENVLKAGFEGILSPTLVDELHQGFKLRPLALESQANPLSLCVDTALLMRSLLLQSDEQSFKILPALPVSLHCGRALHLRLKDKAVVDFEWSKKQLRCMVIRPAVDGELYIQFPKYIDSYRVRRSDSDRGTLFQNHDPITVTKDEVLYLDHFQK